MKNLESELTTEVKLNTLAKSIYNESVQMGLKSSDYVKLMNDILDMTINNEEPAEEEVQGNETDNIKIGDLPIKTKHLIIRYYDPEQDREQVSEWLSNADNQLFLLSMVRRQELNIDQIENNESKIFAMICLKNKKPIGLLSLLNIDLDNRKAEMRKMIGDVEYRGKGYAKEATSAWLRFCTEYKNLNKIYINTIETNIHNVSINRRLGLQLEGLLKKELVIDNVEHDVLRMAYFKR